MIAAALSDLLVRMCVYAVIMMDLMLRVGVVCYCGSGGEINDRYNANPLLALRRRRERTEAICI